MNRRKSSVTSTVDLRSRASFTPSVRSRGRRVSTFSDGEAGRDDNVTTAEDAIHEEIDEIKRYEVRSLIPMTTAE